MFKKIFALCLALVMIFGTLPFTAFAITLPDNSTPTQDYRILEAPIEVINKHYNPENKYWTPVYLSEGISSTIQGATHTYNGSYLEAQPNQQTGVSPVIANDVISFTRVDSYDKNGSPVDATNTNVWGVAGTSVFISHLGVRHDGNEVKNKIWKQNKAGLDTAVTFMLKPNAASGSGKAGIFAGSQKDSTDNQPVHCILTIEADGNGNFTLKIGENGSAIATLLTDKFSKIQILFDFGGDEIYDAANSFTVFVDGALVGASVFTSDENLSTLYSSQKQWNTADGTSYHYGLSFQSLIFNAGKVAYDVKDIGIYTYDDTPGDNDTTNATRGNAFTLAYFNNYNALETNTKYQGTNAADVSKLPAYYGKNTYTSFQDKANSVFYTVDDGEGGRAMQLYATENSIWYDISFANAGSAYTENSGKSFVLSFDLKASAFDKGGSLFSIGDRGSKVGSGNFDTNIMPIFRESDGTLYLGYDGESVIFSQGSYGNWDGNQATPTSLKNNVLTKITNDKFTNVAVFIDPARNVFSVYIDGVDKTGELTLLPEHAIQRIKDAGFTYGFAVTESRLFYRAFKKKYVYIDNLFAYYTDGSPIGEFNAKIAPSISDSNFNEIYDAFNRTGYKYENGAYYYYEGGVKVQNKVTPDEMLTIDADGRLMYGSTVVTNIDEYYVTLANGDIVAANGKFSGTEYDANLILGSTVGRTYYYDNGTFLKNKSCFVIGGQPYTFDANGVRGEYTGSYDGKYYLNGVPYSKPEHVVLTVGVNESARNLAWISTIEAAGQVHLVEASAVTGGVFPTNCQVFSVKSTPSVYVGKYAKSATITGLKENTRYAYVIVEDHYDDKSDIYYFETGSFGDFEFVFFGDTQIANSTHGASWKDTVDKIKANFNTTFLVSAGDQIDTAGSAEQFGYFIGENFTSIALAPSVGPSPHDAPSEMYSEHFNIPNKSTAYGVNTTSADYWYVYNNTVFMHLNMSSGGNLNGEHINFIKEAIAANPNAKWKVVVMHNSLFSTGPHGDPNYTYFENEIGRLRPALAPEFTRLGIDIVLSGHDHVYVRSQLMNGVDVGNDVVNGNTVTDPTGTLYICASSSTGSKYYSNRFTDDFVAFQTDEQRKSVLRIFVTDESLTIKAYYLDDMSIFDTFTIEKTVHVCTEDYEYNGTQHWKKCSECGTVNESTRGSHVFDNACDTTCVCEYTRNVSHNFTGEWQKDVSGHCRTCATPGCNATNTKQGHIYTNNCDTECNTCGYERTVAHDFTGEWQKDANGHWHTCKTEGCGATDTKQGHTSSGAATESAPETCNVCSYVISPALNHTHTPDTEWKTSETHHWNECTGCEGQMLNKSEHVDLNNNGKCDSCDYELSVEKPKQDDVTPPPSDDSDDGTGTVIIVVVIAAVAAGSGFTVALIVIKKKK